MPVENRLLQVFWPSRDSIIAERLDIQYTMNEDRRLNMELLRIFIYDLKDL